MIRLLRPLGFVIASSGLLALSLGLSSPASAATGPVGSGTAGSFAVLGASTITNTGATVLHGDLGLSPGTAITGFPPGVVNGTTHTTDAVAARAQMAAQTAYDDAAGRSPTGTVTADLAGQTLVSGVYSGGTLTLSGTLTLDGQGDPSAVFIFQSRSTLITGTGSRIVLINGAQACNVITQVSSSATLGTNSTYAGTVIALTSITANTGASLSGRLLARNGAVTLDTNSISVPVCAAAVASPTPSASVSPTVTVSPSPTATVSPSPTATVSPSPTASATPTATVSPTATPSPRATVVPSPAAAPLNTGSGGLPRTGAPLNSIALAGLLAIGLGGAMLTVTWRLRRRGRHNAA